MYDKVKISFRRFSSSGQIREVANGKVDETAGSDNQCLHGLHNL